jgi:hypothetical protein
MSASRITLFTRFLIRLVMVAFLLGFMPYLLFKAACSEPKTKTLNEAFGKKAVFGQEPSTPSAPAPFVEEKAPGAVAPSDLKVPDSAP